MFTITLTTPANQPVTVQYVTETNGSDPATPGVDYLNAAGEVVFAPGITQRTITVPVVDDEVAESDETFAVTLSLPVNGVIGDGQGVAVIQDDDGPTNSPFELYVSDVAFQSRRSGTQWRVVLQIRSDSNADGAGGTDDQVRAGVQVSVNFAGRTYTGTTDANGIFRSRWVRGLGGGDHYANVVDLALAGYNWQPLGLDLEDDSDGDGKPDDVLVL